MKETEGVMSLVGLFLAEMQGESSPEEIVLPEDVDWKYMQVIFPLLSEPEHISKMESMEGVQNSLQSLDDDMTLSSMLTKL